MVKLKMRDSAINLVYSTEQVTPLKDKAKSESRSIAVAAAQQKITVSLERKGRGGKSVTVIEGLQIAKKEKDVLLKQLKSCFGTGGALKAETIEVQGDHRNAILLHLQQLGFRPKKAGG